MKNLLHLNIVITPSKKYTAGFIHHFALALVVVGVAVGGTAYLVASQAQTPTSTIVGPGSKCLDDKYDKLVNGNKIQLYSCNKTGAQKWTVNATTTSGTIANGSYCLNVTDSNTTAGTAVDLYRCNGSSGEQWTVNTATGVIVNPHSGKCLDDRYASTANGTQIQIYNCNGTIAQKWTLTATTTSTPTPTPSPTPPAPSPTPTPTPTNTGAYTVSGNLIKNSSSQTVIIHGVDRPSLEWSCSGEQASGSGSGIPASDFATMRNDWNANAVRIPLDQDRWLTGAAQYCSSYKATVEAAVQEAEANKMIVILDLHWSDQGSLSNSASGQQCMPDQNSVTFWQQIATLYKNDPNVWFELYNEPYPPGSSQSAEWNTWQNGGSVTCTALVGGRTATWNAPGMQTLVNTVRATGANNIVLAGGLAFSSVLAGAPTLTGGNVVYAVHPYDNGGSGATNGSWANNFGNQAAKAPVIATEFGDKECGDSAYDSGIMSYFKAHDIGFTGWAWYVGGCSFPSLITNAAGTCVNSMGCTFQAAMKTYSTTPYSD
jgi:endoglucanase